MNNASVNLHCYCNNFKNLNIFNLTNVGNFGTWMCKIESIFYCALFDANALNKKSNHVLTYKQVVTKEKKNSFYNHILRHNFHMHLHHLHMDSLHEKKNVNIHFATT